MNMIGRKDRRKYTRLDAYFLAKYRLVSDPNKESVLASVKDIGGGGICMRVEGDIPVSSIIQIYINFPQVLQSVPTLAKVVWSRKMGRSNRFEIGAQFMEIEEVLQKDIIQHVDNIAKTKTP